MFGSGVLGLGISFNMIGNVVQGAQAAGAALMGLSSRVHTAQQAISASMAKITTGFAATAIVVATLMGPFLKSIDAASKFEFTMSELFAKGGADNLGQLDQLRKQALSVGQTTMFTAQQAAEAQVELAKSGFRTMQILTQLKPATDLAAAGDVGLARATQIASDAMHQFNLGSGDFKRIADVIVNGANLTSQSVEDMGQAFKFIGPNAKALKVSFEEASAYTMFEAQAGLRGTLGARAFGTAMVGIAAPTSKAAKLMKEIGVDAFAGPGRSFVGIIGLVKQLSAALKGATDERVAGVFKTIFGGEAFQEITQLLTGKIEVVQDGKKIYLEGAEALQYYYDMNMKASQGEGIAAKTARLRMDNLKGDFMLFSSMVKTTGIAVGEAFQSYLRPFVQELTKMTASIKGMIETRFGQWLVKLTGTLALLISTMVVLGFVFTVMLPAVWAMVAAFGALLIELAPVIAIVAILAGGIIFLKKSWDSFQDVMNGGEAGNGFLGLMQRIGAVMVSVLEIWTSWNGKTFMLSGQLRESLQRIGILDFVLALATWVVRAKEFFMGFLNGAIHVFVSFAAAWDFMYNSFSSLIDTLNQIGAPFGRLLGDVSGFNLLGNAMSGILWMLSWPLKLMAYWLGFVANSIEFVIVNFHSLITLMSKIPAFWPAVALISKFTGDEAVSEYFGKHQDFKNTFNGSNTGNDYGDNPFSKDLMDQKYRTYRGNFGLDPSIAPPVATPAPSQPLQINLLMDGEKMGEVLVNRIKLEESRK